MAGRTRPVGIIGRTLFEELVGDLGRVDDYEGLPEDLKRHDVAILCLHVCKG